VCPSARTITSRVEAPMPMFMAVGAMPRGLSRMRALPPAIRSASTVAASSRVRSVDMPSTKRISTRSAG
jgi:hypothetical protein